MIGESYMIEYLGKEINVKIDRPLGSKHPKHDFFYPINYGYIEGTVSGDGEEIDVYVLGEFQPLDFYKGKVIAIIRRHNDNEDKLVVSNELNSYDKNQIKALTEFQERFFDIEIITLDYLRKSIRNTVRGLVRTKEEILVLEEVDDNRTYYYLPGGGIEFQESTEDALRREIKEELGHEIKNYKSLITLSNIFEVKGMKAHEITQIYEIELEGDIHHLDGMVMTGDLVPCKVKWINISEFKEKRKVLYPSELVYKI